MHVGAESFHHGGRLPGTGGQNELVVAFRVGHGHPHGTTVRHPNRDRCALDGLLLRLTRHRPPDMAFKHAGLGQWNRLLRTLGQNKVLHVYQMIVRQHESPPRVLGRIVRCRHPVRVGAGRQFRHPVITGGRRDRRGHHLAADEEIDRCIPNWSQMLSFLRLAHHPAAEAGSTTHVIRDRFRPPDGTKRKVVKGAEVAGHFLRLRGVRVVAVERSRGVIHAHRQRFIRLRLEPVKVAGERRARTQTHLGERLALEGRHVRRKLLARRVVHKDHTGCLPARFIRFGQLHRDQRIHLDGLFQIHPLRLAHREIHGGLVSSRQGNDRRMHRRAEARHRGRSGVTPGRDHHFIRTLLVRFDHHDAGRTRSANRHDGIFHGQPFALFHQPHMAVQFRHRHGGAVALGQDKVMHVHLPVIGKGEPAPGVLRSIVHRGYPVSVVIRRQSLDGVITFRTRLGAGHHCAAFQELHLRIGDHADVFALLRLAHHPAAHSRRVLLHDDLTRGRVDLFLRLERTERHIKGGGLGLRHFLDVALAGAVPLQLRGHDVTAQRQRIDRLRVVPFKQARGLRAQAERSEFVRIHRTNLRRISLLSLCGSKLNRRRLPARLVRVRELYRDQCIHLHRRFQLRHLGVADQEIDRHRLIGSDLFDLRMHHGRALLDHRRQTVRTRGQFHLIRTLFIDVQNHRPAAFQLHGDPCIGHGFLRFSHRPPDVAVEDS